MDATLIGYSGHGKVLLEVANLNGINVTGYCDIHEKQESLIKLPYLGNEQDDDFNENISMNLGSYFFITQRFSKLFIKFGKGNIINISSIYANIAPKFGVYENQNFTMPLGCAVIKSGLNHLNRYAAKLLGGNNKRFNLVNPGEIENEHPIQFKNSYRKNCLNKGMLSSNHLLGSIIFQFLMQASLSMGKQ